MMMMMMKKEGSLLRIIIAVTLTLLLCFLTADSEVRCIESERHALLNFKQQLTDPSNRLASWAAASDVDCCHWVGVVCHNRTGHVLQLHLRTFYPLDDNWTHQYSGGLLPTDEAQYEAQLQTYERSVFGGKINPSLLDLKHLIYLDLSGNYFGGTHIPKFLGSMGSLRYLNLSNAGFEGLIPHQLGNLSNLHYLDLGGYNNLYAMNLQWLSGLPLLQHLDLSSANLSQASDWLQEINKLPSLLELRLSYCALSGFIPPPIPSSINFSSLTTLDLSYNRFQNTSILFWVFGLHNLVSLDLSWNQFQGPIPVHLQNLTSLRHLGLSANDFNSSIPNWLYSFSHLEFLNLGDNSLQGTISSAIGNLTSAISIDLSSNELEGKVPRSLGSLCKLREIRLSYNIWDQEISKIFESLSGCVSNGLEILQMQGAQLSGQLIDELGQFKNLVILSLGYNSISGPIPWSIGNLSSLRSLDLQRNQINGTLPQSFGQLSKLESLNIGFNMLEGVVLEVHFANLTRLKTLVAFQNRLTLNVSDNWTPPFQLNTLVLGSWNLGSKFPLWLYSQKQLLSLDISNTGIIDAVPTWLWNLSSQFTYLNISHNQIYGEIPHIPLILSYSSTIDLSSNNFTDLSIIDIGKNEFDGSIPKWIGHRLSSLMILSLHSNNFYGQIPDELCALTSLQILDLSHNKLFGSIPKCVNNFITMARNNNSNDPITFAYVSLDYGNGVVESEFLVESQIPQSMSTLTFLSHLNLSNNNLIGRIPSSTQLQSLNASSFFGNKLCGPPLTDNCTIHFVKPNIENKWGKDFGGQMVDWFFVSMALGFVVGFWVVVGPLFWNKQWRILYFQFLDHLGYKLSGVVTQTC
ncbi:receptor-like protein eix2 [Quercus suber]|uniref:Receptor-like protein eix2 n=1 Tax=Quercus suber TaxID=58331 RepID=A0AAW0ISX7_QUESU